MNIGEAINAVIRNTDEVYEATDGSVAYMDSVGDLIIKAQDGNRHCFILHDHFTKTWSKKEPDWLECNQDTAIAKLQEGGYEVETMHAILPTCWASVRLDAGGYVVYYACGAATPIHPDRKWRYRKVTA